MFEAVALKSPVRSALPLASAGILGLGLLPALGGSDRPLHWFVAAAAVGLGIFLQLWHRVRSPEAPLAPVSPEHATHAGRTLLIITAVSGVLAAGILLTRWHYHGPSAALSVGMPLAALAWLTSIGLRVLRQGEATTFRLPYVPTKSSRPAGAWERVRAGSSRRKPGSSHASL